jgi:hypothetical protein
MKTLTEQTLDKVKELGDKAPEFFGKKQSTLDTWRKTKKVPADAIEKVFAGTLPHSPPENVAVVEPIEPNQYEKSITDMLEWKGSAVEQLKNQSDAIAVLFNHNNQNLSPVLNKLQEDNKLLTTFNAALSEVINRVTALENVRPQGVAHAPTLGQLVGAAQSIDQTPRASLVRPPAITLKEFPADTPPGSNSTHPQDTGKAPTKEQVEEQDRIRASGGDPAIAGTNRPAGPATQPPSANYQNWTAPLPPRR